VRRGSGVHRRREIEMSDPEVASFIDEQRSVIMSTLHPNGSIHCVPMWYGLIDGAITVQTKEKSQKVRNLMRDPRLTFLVEAGTEYSQLRGVEFVGRAQLIDDPDQLWHLAVNIYSRYYGPYASDLQAVVAEKFKKRVGIGIQVDRIVSWDHRKLVDG